MRVLRLLSRVAFICNVSFLLVSFIQRLPYKVEEQLVLTLATLGYVMAIFVNAFVNIWVLGAFLVGRLRRAEVPGWLLVVNALFFLVQLYLISLFLKT